MPEVRLSQVRAMLNNLIGTRSPRHVGTAGGSTTPLRRFWDQSRDAFVASVVYSQQAIVPGNSGQSALIKALKGEPPFDGTSFKRMPPGGPFMSAEDIA